MVVRIINADVMDGLAQLEDESVHCVVCSPPYWSLRDYQTGRWEGGDPACDHLAPLGGGFGASGLANYDNGLSSEAIAKKVTQRRQQYRDKCAKCGAVRIDQQIGLEPTLQEHIAKLVEVFREVRRVLRSDGVAFVNYGDGYASSPPGCGGASSKGGLHGVMSAKYRETLDKGHGTKRNTIGDGFKPKDLLMMPARLAIALQSDGWWLRSDIIWQKTAPMPESVTDRPTKSHEHIFMLTKSPRYFFDAEAVREPDSGQDHKRNVLHKPEPSGGLLAPHDGIRTAEGRNIRDVWTLNTEPFDGEFCTACGRYYDGAEKRQIRVKDGNRYCRCGRHDAWLSHFAVFPSELVEKCILAGTSEKGCCAECGAPWVRETERVDQGWDGSRYGERVVAASGGAKSGGTARSTLGSNNGKLTGKIETTGWTPSCSCGERGRAAKDTGRPEDAGSNPAVPCTVLDPFFGSGTTGLVADRLQRDCIGIELNADYAAMSEKRIAREAGMFARITTETPHTQAEAAE